MLTAVFSDVHGNLEALDAALRDARSHGAERFVCLGDVVGYGADPNACCERVRALGGIVVRGNHDHACSHRVPLEWFNPLAAAAVRWTRQRLSAENRDWLRGLPFEAELDEAWNEGSHYGGGTIRAEVPEAWLDLPWEDFTERLVTLAAAAHYGFTPEELREKAGLREFFGFA